VPRSGPKRLARSRTRPSRMHTARRRCGRRWEEGHPDQPEGPQP
jgi:hypothetical protein